MKSLYTTDIKRLEKKANEREERLRQIAYEQSEEYSQKYYKPYQDALALGQHKVQSLDIVERNQVDPETGDVRITQKSRPATAEDFHQILLQPDDRAARHLAKAMFGEDYSIAMAHREEVLKANTSRHQALEEFKKNGAERERLGQEQRSAQQKTFQETQAKLRESNYKSFAERNPDVAKVADGDTEGEALLKRDLEITVNLFKPDVKLDPEKAKSLHAEMRNRAAHYGHALHKLKAANKKIADLEAKVKGYEGSEPGEGTGVTTSRSTDPKARPDTMKGVLDGFDKIAEARSINYY